MRTGIAAVAFFFGLAALCFILSSLSACATPRVQIDCWHRPKDETLVIDAYLDNRNLK